MDPWLRYDLSALGLSGHDAGLLRLDFRCEDQIAEPRVQIFWWGDNHSEPFEESSVHFTAASGALIVPLDASPRWLTSRRIHGLRIDMANPSACSAFGVENLELLQRTFE